LYESLPHLLPCCCTVVYLYPTGTFVVMFLLIFHDPIKITRVYPEVYFLRDSGGCSLSSFLGVVPGRHNCIERRCCSDLALNYRHIHRPNEVTYVPSTSRCNQANRTTSPTAPHRSPPTPSCFLWLSASAPIERNRLETSTFLHCPFIVYWLIAIVSQFRFTPRFSLQLPILSLMFVVR